jgi:hypothetical protein
MSIVWIEAIRLMRMSYCAAVYHEAIIRRHRAHRCTERFYASESYFVLLKAG